MDEDLDSEFSEHEDDEDVVAIRGQSQVETEQALGDGDDAESSDDGDGDSDGDGDAGASPDKEVSSAQRFATHNTALLEKTSQLFPGPPLGWVRRSTPCVTASEEKT